jgi:hypothetical protein
MARYFKLPFISLLLMLISVGLVYCWLSFLLGRI